MIIEVVLWLTTSAMLFYAGYKLDKNNKEIKSLKNKIADVEFEKSHLFNQVSKTKSDIKVLIGEDSVEKFFLVKKYHLEFALDDFIWAGDSKNEWRKLEMCDGVLIETPFIFCDIDGIKSEIKSNKDEEE
jgi:hypothetical protein